VQTKTCCGAGEAFSAKSILPLLTLSCHSAISIGVLGGRIGRGDSGATPVQIGVDLTPREYSAARV
jgi:hypothetical protein